MRRENGSTHGKTFLRSGKQISFWKRLYRWEKKQSYFPNFQPYLGTLYLSTIHNVWKSPKMSQFYFSILAFSTKFLPIKTDMSGNSVWPQVLGFPKFAKLDHFWYVLMNFCPLNVRSQCWMRLLWFSNTVIFSFEVQLARHSRLVLCYWPKLWLIQFKRLFWCV